jgi:hypothetical protein
MMAWSRPVVLAIAGILVVLAATGITLAVNGGVGSRGTAGVVVPSTSTTSKARGGICERLTVAAYFSPAYWKKAIDSKHPPADMILNPASGPGNAPSPTLQSLVKQAQARGITVLGYSSTVDGQRPAAEVETDVRKYAAWYGVTSSFLDLVKGDAQQFSYYKQLADYIHGAYPGAQVWLNPGVYPDENYMSIGDVVMVFEGTYAQYTTAQVPSWALSYPPARFQDTIYAALGNVLASALQTAQLRDVGHVYVTDLVGSNPYQALPSYWATENAAAVAGCSGPG